MDAMVFGATGFIGRSLVAELLGRGQRVAAAVRRDTLTPWLTGQGVGTGGLTVVTADITRPLTGLPPARDVYNTAARFAFGLGVDEARAVNVTGALNVLRWAATLPGLRRLVHLSGYRVSGARPDYAGLGAYEASKAEADLAVRAGARELGVPLTVANPSTVIGPGQYIGLASLAEDLWNGRLPVLPGGPDVFLPIVTVGYLARFLAEIPASPEGEDYWVLDEGTPLLPELVAVLAAHMGVRAPGRTVPASLVRRLPRRITGADPETLSFLSADRYPTASARAFAETAGLTMPPVAGALRAWADDLVATRFGAASPWLRPYGFRDRTWVMGETGRPAHVLLHGLPMNADLWAPLAARLPGPILAPDLPGLGRSAPAAQPLPAPGLSGPASAAGSLDAWLADLMEPVRTRPVLVAHSLACGPALRFALAHPGRVERLVLIAPAFLQAPGPRHTRSALAAPLLRRMSAARLAAVLGLPEGPEVASAAADLRRPGVARRVIAAMREALAEREATRSLLSRVDVPVEIIIGSADPLTADPGHPVTEIAGAGHYPQLTHPAEVARRLGAFPGPAGPA
ncbi:alpha/beta fold hydrolase [Planobispora takensis]|uniref:Bifunctional protein n=1 Tax=Planobispora takensis TaxID=1367882 RepID=A0A8J3SWC3_9ACTN|nr:alpha/beta fold hydrolase [Planobispora takensis]GIH99985.1 bifunctional protein [Planobispora takensis]